MDEQNQHKNQRDADVQEEQAIEQQMIPFLEDELAAALTSSGMIYVTLPGMCKALGLDTAGQLQRIKRTKALEKGLRLIPLSTPRRGLQQISCLRVDKVALWLAGIQSGSIKQEAYRVKIEYYQEELAPVATQVFLRVFGLPTTQIVPTRDPEILALAEQIDTLTDVTTFLREHMQGLLEAQG